MKNLEPVRRKDAQKLLDTIEETFGKGCCAGLIDKFTFFMSPKNKVYIVSNIVKEHDFSKLRINNVGLYFCECNPGGIRLSIEGSQMIGSTADKNVYTVDDTMIRQWLAGEDIACAQEFTGFVIVKNNTDYCGCGKYREGSLLNFISKARRIQASN